MSVQTPLSALKRIPSSKMSSGTPSSSFKRARVSQPTSFSLSLKKPMTPHPSSDIEEHEQGQPIKFTAVPIRIISGEPMTPSTSTVAFSSSPNRRMMISSSSPTKHSHSHNFQINMTGSGKSEFDHELILEQGKTLIFGRHRHSKSSSSSTSPSSSSTTSSYSTIPSHLVGLLEYPENPCSVIHLSKHASHASRVHAAVEYIKSDVNSDGKDMVRIIVIGQNGIKVKIQNKKRGIRLLQGQKFDLELNQTKNTFAELDFFGSKVLVRLPSPQLQDAVEREGEFTRERLFSSSPISERNHNNQRLQSSLPPSSPPMIPIEIDNDDEELSELEPEHEQPERISQPQPQSVKSQVIEEAQQARIDNKDEEDRQSRQSSPLSPASEGRLSPLPDLEPIVPLAELQPEHITEGAGHEEKQIKAEKIESISHPHSYSRPISRATTPILPPPKDIDLPAILASTVVFSGSSKLSLPDLVKHMLESQPSLKDHGPEKSWSVWVNDALENNEMFGKVERHGKDASGHPLLPHYYYNPSADPDTSRAKELGALVRPLRTAQRTGGKTIDWRPVGRGRRA